MTIGSLDGGLMYDPMTGPFPSVASFCELWAKPIQEGHAEWAARWTRSSTECDHHPEKYLVDPEDEEP